MFTRIIELLEGYDRSKRNQEHYDDFAEWKAAAISAGCAVVKKDKGYKAEGYEGEAGEFGTVDDGEGWLVAKWYKKDVTEAKKVVADPGPVGVLNPSPQAKKNRKMAQVVVDGYTKHIKTSGLNQSYAGKHRKEMNEGMFVVKSKDGIEKRFRDADSDEARAWKEKTAKNIKLAVYSDAYWESKDDGERLMPWDTIATAWDDSGTSSSTGQIERLVKDQHGAGKTDWTLGKSGEEKRDGTTCATRQVRIMFEYGPDDDMGVDELTSDTQVILIARNPKKPSQIDFVKYL